MREVVRGCAAIVSVVMTGCATMPMSSSLDNFNGGFASFTRSELLTFTPLAPPAPMNTRNAPLWSYSPGYDSGYAYGAYYAIALLWWASGSTALGFSSPHAAGGAGASAAGGFSSLPGVGGIRGGPGGGH